MRPKREPPPCRTILKERERTDQCEEFQIKRTHTHTKGTDFNKPYSFMAEKQIACNEIERERDRESQRERE